MRADRLLKLMMLLQGRGRKTAASLSRELEVSVRTLYRDLRALEAAGVPLVAESGPGGGVELMEGFRSDLTGLTEREAEALFAPLTSGPLAALGMDVPLKAALAKLAAGSPSRLKAREEKARRRILLDVDADEHPETGERAEERDAGGGILATLRDAVMAGRRVRLVQRLALGPVRDQRVPRVLAPYGLVWSGGAWYAVGETDGRLRALPAATVAEAETVRDGPDEGRFDIPDDFELADFWKRERAAVAAFRTSYPVTLTLREEAASWLGEPYASRAAALLAAAADRGTAGAEGPPAIVLRFSSAEEARSRLAALGSAATVIAPAELRTALVDLGEALVAAHGGAARAHGDAAATNDDAATNGGAAACGAGLPGSIIDP